MSAIFGILNTGGQSIEPAWITSLQENLAHRGPDGKTVYTEPSLVLGHLLLQVTPESIYDNGPYEEDGLVITANARLDERQSLMQNLQIDPVESARVTDTILLLRAYKKWGRDFVKEIYGDFTFAIWDKNSRELFCGRDQIGVKPLFYYFKDERFVFSTELRSIIRLPFVETKMDQQYFRNRAIAICDQPGNSGWINIIRLQPASVLLLKNDTVKTWQYWKPVYKRNKSFKTEEDSAIAVRELLKKIIGDHTRVIGNVGGFLSAGLDSGTTSCLAAQKLKQENKLLVTASSIYEPGYSNPADPDEMEYIREVLKQEKNILPTYVHHTQHSFVEKLPEKFLRNYAPVNAFFYVDEALYNQFQTNSVRRVLSGYLGDLTVTNSSINPFPILIASGRFSALRKLAKSYNQQDNQPLTAFLKHAVLREFTPRWFQAGWDKFKKREDVSRKIDHLPLRFDNKDRETLQKKVNGTFWFPSRRTKDLILHIWPHDIYLFDEEEDCAASHHQLEVTYPLCDRRLIDLMMQIPVEHLYAGGRRRGLIREAMAGILPERVRLRKSKGSYSPGYTKLIQREIHEILDICNTSLSEVDVANVLDLPKLKACLENLSESKIEDSFTYFNWTIIEIFIWFYLSKTLENKIKK